MGSVSVMELLAQAQAAGLRLSTDGERVIIRGPRHAEPLAKAILARKPEVMAALSCPVCGSPLRVTETERYRYVECPKTPVDYFYLQNKFPGGHMGILFPLRREEITCPSCAGPVVLVEGRGHCDRCQVDLRDEEGAA